jgi:Ribonuclease G/E
VIVTPFADGLNIAISIQDIERKSQLKQLVTEGFEHIPYGMILRSACASASDNEIIDDCRNMINAAQNVLSDENNQIGLIYRAQSPYQMAWREWSDIPTVDKRNGVFSDYGVLELIDELKDPKVITNNSNYYIESTKAFVAIDVNTGGDMSFAAGLKANLAMAKDLPRQLRLRGLGGQVVIDPAPMSRQDRKTLENAIKSSLRRDTIETNFVGWTSMGLIELQRARIRPNWLTL